MKRAVEHDGSLYQGEMSPLSERPLVAQVVNVVLIELRAPAPLDWKLLHLQFDAKLDEVSDG